MNTSCLGMLGFLIDCNTFWNIFGTTNNATKSGPSDPVFITKVLHKLKEIWQHPYNIFFISENLKNLKTLEGSCT